MKKFTFDLLENSAKRLFSLIDRVAGKDPLVFLDTGAIIDFERLIDQYKHFDSSLTSTDFYEAYRNNGVYFLVTENMLTESLEHNSQNRKNGKPEISHKAILEIWKRHQDYVHFVKTTTPLIPYDKVRYDTHWASMVAFSQGHKKESRDPPSENDKALVASSLWSRYLLYPSYNDPRINTTPTGVVVISPDEHIKKTVDVLMGRDQSAIERMVERVADKPGNYKGEDSEFNYNGINVISSR